MAALAEHYRWPHDYWRRIGWREFRMWLRRMHEAQRERAEGHLSKPETWRGADADPWWREQRAKRDRMRGR